MKRRLLTLAALMSATLGLNAQQMVEVYSAYDVNQDKKVLVDDVTSVVNATLANSAAEDKTVVDAAKLNALLLDIYQKLESIDSRLSALEGKQCNCNGNDEGAGAGTDDGTGEGSGEGADNEAGEGTNEDADGKGIVTNGHDYVDLGLKDAQGRTIYWAKCNIGADKPEDAGLYFAWGETVGYAGDTSDGRKFDWASYSLCNGGETSINKYCTSNSYGRVDNKKVLDPENDAAHANWGGDWRMPTDKEQDQLLKNCTWTWDDTNKGYTIVGPNGKSIFLPAAGCRDGSRHKQAGSYGYYWSSSLFVNNSDNAYDLSFDSDGPEWKQDYRYYGQSIRAVCVSAE